jgi:hypothetical protein
MKALKALICILFLIYPNVHSFAAHDQLESYYANIWCKDNNGSTEIVLIDNTRADCITKDYAVEVEFAPKWAEAIGQSLHYGFMTNKTPSIVLIFEHSNDMRFYMRLMLTIEHYSLPIRVWKVEHKSR